MRLTWTRVVCALTASIALVVSTLFTVATGGSTASAASTIPGYDHVVVAVFENHQQGEVIGSSSAPYLTGLSKQGANFTQSYAIEHPSQPNYLDLFSGSNQGVTDDSCPHSVGTDNVAHQLISAGKTFTGYSEDLPSAGSTTCSSGNYARKHAPWTNFTNLDQSTVSKPYSSFPSDFSTLPTYSWVVPNLCNDMHNCSVSTGDTWSKEHLDAYAQWAKTHNSLLIVTFDEDDYSASNRIPTLFVGAHINAGDYSEHIDHYSVLRTVEDMYGLPALGGAASRNPITDIFSTGGGGGSLVSGAAYTIARTGSTQVIDDPYSSKTNGTQMLIYSNHSGANQHWMATAVGGGYYTFTSAASGQCLDDAGSSASSGAKVIQWPCSGAANQKWKLVASGSGYALVNQVSGLAVTPAGTADNSLLTQEPGNQPWTFTQLASATLPR